MTWKFYPEKIRARLDSARYWKVDISVAESLDDIEMLVAEVEKIPAHVRSLVDHHAEKWAEKPADYWFYRLVEEIGELGSSLAEHDTVLQPNEGPELELAEIASMCINWLRKGADPIQLCGHPRSAIVTDDDLGGPGTSYCGMCLEEGRALTTQKPDWKLPDAPRCEHGETAIAACYHAGDGWEWGWHTDCCGPDPFAWSNGQSGIGPEITWPFVGDFVSPRDWQLAGFTEM